MTRVVFRGRASARVFWYPGRGGAYEANCLPNRNYLMRVWGFGLLRGKCPDRLKQRGGKCPERLKAGGGVNPKLSFAWRLKTVFCVEAKWPHLNP